MNLVDVWEAGFGIMLMICYVAIIVVAIAMALDHDKGRKNDG
jgi:hypothetical protein